MEKQRPEDRRESEIVYSRSVKAGKRIYYLDVRKARNADLYLSITESKRLSGDEETPRFEKHKLFLYKEDFERFTEELENVIGFVREQLGDIEARRDWTPEQTKDAEETVAEEEAPKKKGIFGFLK